MFAALRIIRQSDGVLEVPPISLSINREEAIAMQRYLDDFEMPLVGTKRKGIDDNLAEAMASIQYILLDSRAEFAFKDVSNQRIFLNRRYRFNISTYNDYFV